MFLLRTSKYYHIIQVDDTICQVQLPQGVLHEVLESCRSIGEPKRHTSKLVKPQIAHGESSVLSRPWCHPDLPESTFEIHCGEMCSTHHTLQCLLDPWQRVGILFVCALSLQKFTQKCNEPSFFLTSTTVWHHRDWLGCIAPASSISQSEAWTSSKSGGGICLNHSLKGLLSVMQISCSTALVQPSSFPSSAKISRKARTRS